MERTLRLSTFECFLENEANQVVIKVTGVLQGPTFTVSALGYEIGIRVVSVGEDQFGKFVLVEPQKRQLGDGWTFELQLYARGPDEVPGSELTIQQFSDDVADLATQRGIDLDKVLLINPPRAGFSIGFNWAELINGKGLISKVTEADRTSENRLPS
jgi:hypothetical protein